MSTTPSPDGSGPENDAGPQNVAVPENTVGPQAEAGPQAGTGPHTGAGPQTSAQQTSTEESFGFAGVPDAFQRLWNPHRIAYVQKGQDQVKHSAECPFCAAPQRSDEDSLIVHRGSRCFVVLNLYPYNPGHLLICPYRHVPDLTDLTVEEAAEFTRLAQVAMTALRRIAAPGGFNLGMNQGKAGGAGIAAHLHQHVVPRWGGDGNFLPIIAQTKNMSQTLGETHALLHEAWDEAAQDMDHRQALATEPPTAC